LPSRSKNPPPKPKLVNKLAHHAAQKKNAQLPTTAIRHSRSPGFGLKRNSKFEMVFSNQK